MSTSLEVRLTAQLYTRALTQGTGRQLQAAARPAHTVALRPLLPNKRSRPGAVNLKWNVGAFRNTYGGLGQYDVGHYNAPIIGSPFGVGETLTGQYDLDARYTLFVEHGFMGRRPL